jgi:glutamate-1-semialdehyde 2,1-aminomutase
VRNLDLESAIELAEHRYAEAHPDSRAHMERAGLSLPGGNTRTVIHVRPFPFVVAGSEGVHIRDIDGHRYLDLLGEYTAGLFGHSNETIRQAVLDALDKGWVHGGHIREESALAEALIARFPSLDMLRFCNSGTEANLMAIVTARVFTGRDAILVFDGAYHGGVLKFGDGPAPTNAPFPTILGNFNDAEGAAALIEEHRATLAAVIVEPMQGGAGCIPGTPDFLRALREACTDHGVLLIFDEVMTSRLSGGGLQGLHGVTPDLTTLGKYIGGGLPLGAFGGRAEIMRLYDPNDPKALAHAGTFNNNQLSMAAGVAAMTKVFSPEAADALSRTGNTLRDRLNAMAADADVPMQFTGLGSMMNVHFSRTPIRSVADARRAPEGAAHLFHHEMLARGIYCAGRGMINLSLPLRPEHLDALAGAVGGFLEEHSQLLRSLEG